MEFEKKLGRLEEIVGFMEKGELSLENSLSLFEEGVKLSRECHSELTEAENKVKLLLDQDEQGQVQTVDFQSEER